MTPAPTHRVEKSSRAARQAPVSCEFCRAKKLKCDRQNPCSNCVTREVSCRPSGKVPVSTCQSVIGGQSIQERLNRIEARLGLHEASPAAPIFQDSGPVQSHATTKDDIAEYRELNNAVIRDSSASLPNVSDTIIFRIAPARSTLHAEPSYRTSCVWLPPKEEAACLIEVYAEYVDNLQHVLYMPSVWKLLDDVYATLEMGTANAVRYSDLGLLLSVFACSTFYWVPTNRSKELNVQTSSEISSHWVKAALDVMEQSRRTGSGALEDIQAILILFFLLYNTEGFSYRARVFAWTALTIARDLGLHRIDLQGKAQTKIISKEERSLMEVKRRVWWYLASSDWSMSLFPGNQEGTYSINPKHMRVNRPRHINDTDLEHPDPLFTRPVEEPTTMSYFLQRIRFGELCREVTDLMPLGVFGDGVSYRDILALDSRFTAFLDELPIFFKIDDDSRAQSRELDEKFPHITIHRHVLAFLVPARRCALHQIFLARGLEQPYIRSRKACLSSARTILRNKRLLESAKLPSAPIFARQFGAMHHMFMGTVILAMDLSYNRVPNEEHQRREELIDACRMLEADASAQKPMAAKLLEALLTVLAKHNIYLDLRNPSGAAREAEESDHSDMTGYTTATTDDVLTAEHYESFDEIWRQWVAPGPSVQRPILNFAHGDFDMSTSGM